MKRFRITQGELKAVQARFRILGMHCAGCATEIEKRLSRLPGVRGACVDFATGTALVEIVPGTSLREIVKAVRDAGYDVALRDLVVRVDGLQGYDDCVALEARLRSVKGVVEATATSGSNTVRIVYNPLETSSEELKRIIRGMGYRVEEAAVKQPLEHWPETTRLKRIVATCLPLSVAHTVLLYLYGAGFTSTLSTEALQFMGLFVSTFTLFYAGQRIFASAVRGLLNRVAGMDLLVAVGTGSAYLYSLVVTAGLLEGRTFFEVPALVLSIVAAGRLVEAHVRERLAEATAISAESLLPRRARVVRNGRVVEILTGEVKVGDVVEVWEGERIPVDGVIVEGYAAVDESLFTSEPLPAAKAPGDRVLAGSIVVEGYLRVRTTRVSENTLIAQITRLVEYAQTAKPKLQGIADRVAGLIAWAALAGAAATFTYWYVVAGLSVDTALLYSITVLVVACPCALGLATPLAVAAGLWRAASTGILIRDINVVEKVHRLSIVVFDKTGTLTEGKPRLEKILALEPYKPREILEFAASAEKRSNHPLAKAITREAERLGLNPPEPKAVETIPGHGVVATVAGYTVAVGDEKIVEDTGATVDEEMRRKALELRMNGYTVVYVVIGTRVAGLLAFTDTVKPEAQEAVKELKKMGLKTAILTGDSSYTAETISKKLGIDIVIAGVRPEEKAETIRKLQRQGHTVAMVGDGVNDAPSLAQADIGIAIAAAADLAHSAGDIILVANNLKAVSESIKLLRKIRRKTIENLAWAFTYNILLLPVAAGALHPHLILTPELAALAMTASSITVTLNALTLTHPPRKQ